MGIRRGRKHVRVAGIFLGKIFNAVKTILGKKIMNKKVGNILHVPTLDYLISVPHLLSVPTDKFRKIN